MVFRIISKVFLYSMSWLLLGYNWNYEMQNDINLYRRPLILYELYELYINIIFIKKIFLIIDIFINLNNTTIHIYM